MWRNPPAVGFTDVIMPEMSGRQLAETMLQRHPELPVLYMSGYSDGLLGTSRILAGGLAFIEKPFTAQRLLTQIGTMFADHATSADTTAAPRLASRTGSPEFPHLTARQPAPWET